MLNTIHCLSHDLPTQNQIHMDLTVSIKICANLFLSSYAENLVENKLKRKYVLGFPRDLR